MISKISERSKYTHTHNTAKFAIYRMRRRHIDYAGPPTLQKGLTESLCRWLLRLLQTMTVLAQLIKRALERVSSVCRLQEDARGPPHLEASQNPILFWNRRKTSLFRLLNKLRVGKSGEFAPRTFAISENKIRGIYR
jgi:hypothetical protein